MKNIVLLCLSFATLQAVAQGMDSSDVIISTGAGFSILSGTHFDSSGTKLRTDDGYGITIPTYTELIFNKKIGLGLHFNYTRLFNGSMFRPNSSVMEFGATLTLHRIKWTRFDVAGYIGAGYSRYRSHVITPDEIQEAGGLGILYGLYPRVYFGENRRLGMGLQLDGCAAIYKNGTIVQYSMEVGNFRMNLLRITAGVGIFIRI